MRFSSVLIVHVLDEQPSNKVRAAIQRNIRQKAKTQHYLRFNPLQILSQPALIPNPHSLKVIPQILALCLAKRIRPFPICHREASCSNGVCLLETESSWARGGPWSAEDRPWCGPQMWEVLGLGMWTCTAHNNRQARHTVNSCTCWRQAPVWASNVRGSWAGDVDMYCTQQQTDTAHS